MDESGQALVLAMVIVVVGILLTLATVTFAITGLKTSHTDLNEEGSLHAADSGIDVALWYTNKLLLGNESDDLLGFVSGALQTVGCANVNAGSLASIGVAGGGAAPTIGLTTSGSVSWCAGAAGTNGDAPSSTFEYWESTQINVAAAGNVGQASAYNYSSSTQLLALDRAVVSVGDVGGNLTRELAVFTLCLGGKAPTAAGGVGNCGGTTTVTNGSGALASLWSETYFVRCPAPPTDYSTNSTFASEPDAGCPFVPAPATPSSW